MFAVWLMFGILGIPIREEFGLTDVQLSWLSAVAVLNGSLWRLPAGMVTDRIGGRKVFAAHDAQIWTPDAHQFELLYLATNAPSLEGSTHHESTSGPM